MHFHLPFRAGWELIACLQSRSNTYGFWTALSGRKRRFLPDKITSPPRPQAVDQSGSHLLICLQRPGAGAILARVPSPSRFPTSYPDCGISGQSLTVGRVDPSFRREIRAAVAPPLFSSGIVHIRRPGRFAGIRQAGFAPARQAALSPVPEWPGVPHRSCSPDPAAHSLVLSVPCFQYLFQPVEPQIDLTTSAVNRHHRRHKIVFREEFRRERMVSSDITNNRCSPANRKARCVVQSVFG